ncbi:MAG: pantoate--beta-alanine ligase [Alphaproteobacteria bacterium]|nr:pantoate--beta-alanine ligase [Alphaproteobacteria bacterium]
MGILTARTRDEIAAIVSKARQDGQTIGFVPTMGALHAGHLSLVKLALEKCDFVVVSIFVNPTQFAPHEDFDRYPRMPEADSLMLAEAGASCVFLPDEAVIYPDGKDCAVKAGAAAKGLETDFRPHFFDGVVNVVSRLFDLVKPDAAVFGQKDFQQLQVIREMVEALGLSIEIVGAPIARDESGLALSSRNAYLSSEELSVARRLNKVLLDAVQALRAGEDQDEVMAEAAQALVSNGFEKVDYVRFKPEWQRVLAAAWLGKTRLIDNMGL